MTRRTLLILVAEIGLLALAYLHVCHEVAGGFGFPLDDSWIHAHFARNITEGRGMVYNPGQPVTPTGVLYPILLSPLYAISSDAVANAIVLGLLLHLGTAFLVYLTALELRLAPLPALGCACVFAAIPRMMWGALSGMEVPLYVFLVCLGMYLHLRFRLCLGGFTAYLSTAAFALAALTRPECAVLLVVSLFDKVLAIHARGDASGWTAAVRVIALQVGLFALMLAPAVAYNVRSFGQPLPPAFYAKANQVHGGVDPGLAETRPRAFCSGKAHWSNGQQPMTSRLLSAEASVGQAFGVCCRDNWVLALGLVAGVVASLPFGMRRTCGGGRLLLVATVAIPAATGFVAAVGHSHPQLAFQFGRYSGYLAPMLALLGLIGAGQVEARMAEGDRRLRIARWDASAASRFVLPVFLVGAALVALVGNRTMATRYAWGVQNVNALQVALGRWAAGLPRGTVVAVNDAGAIAYFSRLRILDTVGVVNPEVVPYLRRNEDRQIGLLQYMEDRRPDYVIVFPNWYPDLTAREGLLRPVKSVSIKHNTICGGDEMVVYRPVWAEKAPTGANGSTVKARIPR